MKANVTRSNVAKRGVPEGLWIQCRQCKATIFRKEAEARFNVCPECDYHFYLPAARAHRPAAGQGQLRGVVHRPAAVRPARLQGPGALCSSAWCGAEQDRHGRRRRGRPGLHPRPAGRLGRHRLRLHGWQHGVGRRREADARGGGGDPAALAADLRQRLRRRRADAGGHPVADADGQGVVLPWPATTRPAACTSRS